MELCNISFFAFLYVYIYNNVCWCLKRNNFNKFNFVETDLTPRSDVTSDCPPSVVHAEAGFNATFQMFLSHCEVTYQMCLH